MSKKTIILGATLLIAAGGVTYLLKQQKPSDGSSAESDIEPVAIAPTLADTVRKTQSSKEAVAIATKLSEIARKNKSLSQTQALALMKLFRQPKPEVVEQEDWLYLIHTAFNAVRKNADQHENNEVALTLDYLARNASDNDLRVYALQHVSFWFEKEKKHRALLAKLLLEESEKAKTTAGIASRALHQLLVKKVIMPGEYGIDNKRVKTLTLNLVSDGNALGDVRREAIADCADYGYVEALPEIRRIAGDTKLRIHLRKAAVASIREIGTKEDIGLIQKLHQQGGRLAQATGPALQRLNQRFPELN